VDTWIHGGLVITAGESYRANVGIENGRIAQVGPGLGGPAEQVLDAQGKWILPGIIDAHTHMELALSTTVSADDFTGGTQAAACGGVTTIIDFSLHHRGESLESCLKDRRRMADGHVAVDYGLHAEIIDLNEDILAEIPRLIGQGVTSFKLFLAYRRDGRMVDDGDLYAVLKRAGETGGLVLVHAENGPIVEVLTDRLVEQGNTAPIYHARSRPNQVEEEAVQRAIAISRFARGNLYIVHLSTGEGLRVVEEAHQQGTPVWAETCPQYLLLDEEAYLRDEGIDYVATPPLRTPRDREALWAGLAGESISVISTDHCPFTKAQKRQGGGNFSSLPSGLPGVETSLQLIHSHGVDADRLTPNQLVAAMSTNPAKIFGLYPAKGSLEVGSDADLVIFDPQAEYTISAERLHMATDFSPYDGFTGRGAVLTTMLRGVIISRNGQYCGPPGFGQFLRRRKFEPQRCQFWSA
jgi:dihydropyrimidinase